MDEFKVENFVHLSISVLSSVFLAQYHDVGCAFILQLYRFYSRIHIILVFGKWFSRSLTSSSIYCYRFGRNAFCCLPLPFRLLNRNRTQKLRFTLFSILFKRQTEKNFTALRSFFTSSGFLTTSNRKFSTIDSKFITKGFLTDSMCWLFAINIPS